jgi:hypothetical protein
MNLRDIITETRKIMETRPSNYDEIFPGFYIDGKGKINFDENEVTLEEAQPIIQWLYEQFVISTTNDFTEKELEILNDEASVVVSEGGVRPIGSKFRIGDKVKLSKPYNTRERPIWDTNMNGFIGEVLTIQGFTSGGFVTIREDDQEFWYNENWLTLVEEY